MASLTTTLRSAARATSIGIPKSAFLEGADSYILLTLTKNPAKMVVEIKGLDGTALDRKVYR